MVRVRGMQEQYKQTLRFASYHAGGVALATALLMGVMGGGFIAGLLAMPLVVIGMGALAVAHEAHEMKRQRVMVAPSATTTEVPRWEGARDREIPIIASVTEAEGVCPLGYRFRVGETWNLDGDAYGLPGNCPTAATKLQEAAEHLRHTEKTTVGVAICQTKKHRVFFELRRQPVEYADQKQSPE